MSVWIFILLFIIIFSIVVAVKYLLRKTFKIPKVKKKTFSYNHINKTHRNVDLSVRFITLAVYVILIFQLFYHDFSINLFLFLMTLLFTSENFVRAFFEWKFSPNPKESILSLAEAVLIIIAMVTIIRFDFFEL